MRLMALSLGVHRPQLAHRTGLTCPRPHLFFPPLRRFLVMLAMELIGTTATDGQGALDELCKF